MKKYLLWIVPSIIFISLTIYLFININNIKKENKELLSSKEKYINLNNEINKYTKLKENIDIINNESVSLNDKIVITTVHLM